MPFTHWDDVEEWTGKGEDTGWRGRRLVFEGCWVLSMAVDEGYCWAHSHPQSQVLWVVRGELRVALGDPEKPDEVETRVIGPRDLVLIPSNTYHDITALVDTDVWEVRGMEGADEWERHHVRAE